MKFDTDSPTSLARAMLDSCLDVILLLRLDGRIREANAAAVTTYGYRLDQLRGMTISDLRAPETRGDLPGRMASAAVSAGELFETVHLRCDGSMFPVEVSVRSVSVDGDRYVVSIVRDISTRRLAEAVLRNAERRLRDAQRVAHVGSWDRDLATGAITWSEELSALYGVDPAQPVPGFDQLGRFYTAESWRALSAAVARTVSTGLPFTLDVEIVRADGTTIWATTNCEALRDGKGLITGTRGTVLDITERKRAEQDKDGLTAQLLQAQKMEAVGRLAGGVAHDFNNMLAVIVGHAELALENLPPADDTRRDLEEIHAAAQKSASLTRQLLAFARKQTIRPQTLAINQTVAETLKMLRRLIGEGIEVIWKPGGGAPAVVMDPSQLDQLLVNIAVNARDAIGGVGTITIETEAVALDGEICREHPGLMPGEYMRLTVTDTGCGMSPEVMSKAFEPFYTTKDAGAGTGLGLATVYGIVKQNGGHVGLKSQPGRGTAVVVYLPCATGALSIAGTSADSRAQVQGRERVLVVEDADEVRALTVTMLTRLGYSVTAAATPVEALEMAGRSDFVFDLLLTDVVLPEMNGRELYACMAAIRPGIKCLFMSGYTGDAGALRGVLDEGHHFLQKPFSKMALGEAVRRALGE